MGLTWVLGDAGRCLDCQARAVEPRRKVSSRLYYTTRGTYSLNSSVSFVVGPWRWRRTSGVRWHENNNEEEETTGDELQRREERRGREVRGESDGESKASRLPPLYPLPFPLHNPAISTKNGLNIPFQAAYVPYPWVDQQARGSGELR